MNGQIQDWIKDYRGWSIYCWTHYGEITGYSALGPKFEDVIDAETLDDLYKKVDKEAGYSRR